MVASSRCFLQRFYSTGLWFAARETQTSRTGTQPRQGGRFNNLARLDASLLDQTCLKNAEAGGRVERIIKQVISDICRRDARADGRGSTLLTH